MAKPKEKPSKEDEFAKQFILLTDKVHLGVVRVQGLLLVSTPAELIKRLFCGCNHHVNFEDSPDDHREESEDHIVEGDGPAEPKGLPRSQTVEGIDELDCRKDHVFVEEVQNHLCDSDVVEPAVIEDELPEETELANGVVGHLSSSGAFFSIDTNPYVGFHDHVDIISSIPNG